MAALAACLAFADFSVPKHAGYCVYFWLHGMMTVTMTVSNSVRIVSGAGQAYTSKETSPAQDRFPTHHGGVMAARVVLLRSMAHSYDSCMCIQC
jgi:hypothetical protein